MWEIYTEIEYRNIIGHIFFFILIYVEVRGEEITLRQIFIFKGYLQKAWN